VKRNWAPSSAAALLLVAGVALAVGEPGNTATATNWCDMTAAQRDCICGVLECLPDAAKAALEAAKGKAGEEGKPWASTGTICVQRLGAVTAGTEETGTPLGRTVYDDSTGKLKGVVFPPALFAGQGAESKMWKKVAVSQEGNRLTYGDHAPVPYAGLKPGTDIPMEDIEEYACWKNAFVGVNNGFAEAQDARSRSTTVSTMIGSDPPQGVAAADWKKFLCQTVLPNASGAITVAKQHKTAAENALKAKQADGPGNSAVATRENLKKWIGRLCKEIELAQAAYDAAKAACEEE